MHPRSDSWSPSGRPDMPFPITPRPARLILALAGAILLGAPVAGCASIGPKPWQRDLMARPEMQLTTHPLLAAADMHIYFSKEASSGGRSFAGGGCGCN